ncbi:MAG: DUF934 domain-containing protein [Rhodobacteraceae bacterium]|nr:DUF934 domain-containing protein [Paracoccaceae bacterium]
MTQVIRDEGFYDDDLVDGDFVELQDLAGENQLLTLPNDTEATDVAPHFAKISTIRIPFASFSDGRGFGLARQLRQLGFTGRLRASGHLISDQYFHARRCGFDEIEITEKQSQRQTQPMWVAQSNWDKETYQDRLLRAS